MKYTRRELGQMTLGATAAGVLARSTPLAAADLAAPAQAVAKSSLINGVQVGLIVPYSFGQDASDAVTILDYLVQLGISAVEMQDCPAEQFAGRPAGGRGGGGGGGGGRGPGGPPAPGTPPTVGGVALQTPPPPPTGAAQTGAPPPAGAGDQGGRGRGRAMTPEEQAAQQAQADTLRKWRLGVSMDRYKWLRNMYNSAGVKIYAFKLGLNMNMTDEEYDYVFNVAEALGANHVTMELPASVDLLKRIGAFAEKRKIYAAYHTHTQGSMTAFDAAFAASKANMSNIDVGHYVAGTGESPIPFFTKFHDRISSFHMKDRKTPANGAANMPWGQGDTPLAELMQLVKKNKWRMPATIELEYPVPAGSTRALEIGKCLEYCKKALA
jgi:sugar phosphate isomerase/epimerase